MLGIATSLNQFSRSIGGSVGVSARGALMTRALAGVPLPQGAVTSVSAIALTGMSRLQFAAALHQVFVAGAVIAVCALAVTLLLPPVSFSRGVPPGAGEQMIAAEMTTLDPDEEPTGVLD